MHSANIAELFRVRDRFLRSAHLERDFDDPKALSGYILTQQIRSHAERLVVGLRSNSGQRAWRITGDYGSGKSSFALLLAQILSGRKNQLPGAIRDAVDFKRLGVSAPRLLPILVTGSTEPLAVALLRAVRRDLLTRAETKRSARIIQRIDAELAKPREGAIASALVVDLVTEACSHIVLAGKGTGLLILLDELGKFLEYGALHPEQQDVFLLQQLAEMACRSSRHPVLIVGLLHQGFNAYAEHLSPSAQKEWEKVAGRFDELLFNQPLEHTAMLIADAMNIRDESVPNDVLSMARSDMSKLLDTGWYGPSHGREALLKTSPRLYPLHASVIPALLRLFTRFGQNERSLFGFLLSNEPFGLQEFSSNTVSTDHFYRLHHLYDYARYSLGHRIGRESFRNHWNHIDSMIESFPENNPLEVRVLKVVGLLNLLDTHKLLASEQVIVLAVGGDPEAVKGAIRRLATKRILYYRGVAGGYCLWPHTSVNLDKAYQDATREVGQITHKVSHLITKHLDTRPLVARRHYIETGSLRHFDVQYCTPVDVAAHKTVDYSRADGKIVVVLCESQSERDVAIRTVRSQEYHDAKTVLYAIPHPLRVISGLLQEVQRWEWVQANVPELANDSFAAEEVSRQLSTAEEALQQRLASILNLQRFNAASAPSFVRTGSEVDIDNGRQLLAYLSEICDKQYDKSPKIANELINRRVLSSAAAAARGKLIQAVFAAPSKLCLGMDPDKKPPEMSMYLSVLKAARLHRESHAEWKLSVPTEGNDPCHVRPALQCIQESLERSETKRMKVSDILSDLRRPPFGVRDGLSPLLLCIFAMINEQHIAFYDDGRFMRQMVGLDLTRLFKLPEQFEVQYCKMSGIRTSLFERLMSVLELSSSRIDKPDVLDVVRPLCIFAGQLPSYTQKTTKLSSVATNVRSALLGAREPALLLFRELPLACGFEDFTKPGRTHKETDLFIAAFRAAIDELRAAYPLLRDRIKSDLLASFELDVNDAGFRTVLANRARAVMFAVTEPRLKAFCNRLGDLELGLPEWIESLGSMVSSVPPSRWSDSDEARFSQELSIICARFRRVETFAFGSGERSQEGSALRLSITKPDGTESDRIVHIRREDEDLVSDIERQIIKAIRTAPSAGVAAATRALLKMLGEGRVQ
jgi:hypothetical protein